MEINKKFTIVSSSYNKAKYLNDWFKSIMVQKYRPLEVVLVNDYSTDKTLNMIKDIDDKFNDAGIEFIFVNNRERLYCASSYKNAVGYAAGSYVGILDADDMLASDAVEYIMSLYSKYPDIAWIYTQFLWCDEKMKKRRVGFNRAPIKESLLSLADKKIHGIGCGWRTFNYKIGRPEKLFKDGQTCAVDKYMCYRLEEFGPGLFTNKICYIHRGHPIDLFLPGALQNPFFIILSPLRLYLLY